MGIKIDDIGEAKLKRVYTILQNVQNGSGFYHALNAAMKRAIASAKTQAGRYAAERYAISKGQFMAKTNFGYVLKSNSIGIVFSGEVIPLIEFGGTSGDKKGGVHVGPKLGGGTLSRAFITAAYGTTGVWERIGKPRIPIEQKYGPSTGHMMQDEGVSEKLVQHMEEVFDSRIEHEITRILNGW